MGDGHTWAEDQEYEWDHTKQEASIQDVSWSFTDEKAEFARIGFQQHKFTGKRLKLYVKHSVEAARLSEKQKEELKQLEEFEKFERIIKSI